MNVIIIVACIAVNLTLGSMWLADSRIGLAAVNFAAAAFCFACLGMVVSA